MRFGIASTQRFSIWKKRSRKNTIRENHSIVSVLMFHVMLFAAIARLATPNSLRCFVRQPEEKICKVGLSANKLNCNPVKHSQIFLEYKIAEI